jgi:hypothetical protein
MNINKIILCATFVLITALNIAAQERRLLPVDEGRQDRSFLSFRGRLLEAVKRRESKSIIAALDTKILNSFGGNGGIEEFVKNWKPDDPDSRLWDEMFEVLSLGGTFTDKSRREFCAPYVFTRFPDDLDPFEYSAIIGDNVSVLAEPHDSAPIIGRLSYNIVKFDYEGSVADKNIENGFSWVKIVTPDGRPGYVSGKQIRNPGDYRICFKRQRGVWKITTFVAGD